jgi:hypothetical protein
MPDAFVEAHLEICRLADAYKARHCSAAQFVDRLDLLLSNLYTQEHRVNGRRVLSTPFEPLRLEEPQAAAHS